MVCRDAQRSPHEGHTRRGLSRQSGATSPRHGRLTRGKSRPRKHGGHSRQTLLSRFKVRKRRSAPPGAARPQPRGAEPECHLPGAHSWKRTAGTAGTARRKTRPESEGCRFRAGAREVGQPREDAWLGRKKTHIPYNSLQNSRVWKKLGIGLLE